MDKYYIVVDSRKCYIEIIETNGDIATIKHLTGTKRISKCYVSEIIKEQPE